MPPKASTGRGGARGRGRGRGRGGASAAAAAAAVESTRPEPTAAAPADDAGEDSLFMPKDEPMRDAPAPESADVAMADAPGDAAVTTTETGNKDVAASASHPEDPRISSVRSSETPAASSGPGSPASNATRGKKAAARLPTFKGRRSKEERDAMEAEAAAKRRERLAEQSKAQKAAGRGRGDRGRGRGRGGDRGGRGGRGGYMGSSGEGGGIFSSGVVVRDSRNNMLHRGKTFGAGGAPGIKREARARTTQSAQGEQSGDEEDGGYISSDPEEATLGPRKDVDTINLISDDEEEIEEAGPSTKRRERYNAADLAPVRIQRKEHENRAVGITGEGPGATKIKTEEDISSPRKGKGKAKDVEVIASKDTWKGAWGWGEDSDGTIRIKDEPTDEPMTVPSDIATVAGDSAVKDPPSSPDLSRKTKFKPKPRRKPRFRAPTALVTEEDRLEEERHNQNMDVLRDELGEVVLTPHQKQQATGAPGDATAATTDTEGDTPMKDEAAQQQSQLQDKKEDRVYLFQLPPIIPSLHIDENSVKKEPSSPTQTRTQPGAVDLTGSSAPATAGIDLTQDVDAPAQLASGKAGKLRIHASGRATLDWGGTSLELTMGTEAHFLQDIIISRLLSEEERGQSRIGGEAMAFGQVRGKFVVTPDWDEIVG
ncbi:uncharacterized protein K452DRAFT_290462 [Aplosporella prunicola CBS 121167]|uniref:RNA polymerase III RPC4-domain-containing protein n=1 Tax=Aplosporella prunicola CBS 121167 TaxID=1176127 RepID=A0A6A6B5W8_9PEZI|nr:uncharacterized protein K452DRAFT_290462 [Aplosporella prunicola CBS 121167]KAF2138813.1 hypothetical protein K452DRAFT_290462 [Aplosporella prunicola CBS 121167]